MEPEKTIEEVVPDEFVRIIKDFVRDIQITFPEYEPLINKWFKTSELGDLENSCVLFLFSFCKKKYAPRFFDILYQNGDIFKEDSDIDTEFLPYIHFKNLWACEISEKTRDTIWKYLQLILFSVVGSIEKQEEFGDTAKLFEAINDEDFKSKLEETIGQMHGLFGAPSGEKSGLDISNQDAHFNMENMPNAEELHEHISGMLDGKIGMLAKEIAEETAQNLNVDLENVSDMKDLFNKLIKNPTKLMGLVKNIGDKIDQRMKSGELKESELMSEASEIMQKMKNMPGMESMLSRMAGMGGGKGKMNMGAMEAQLNRNMKAAQMKERMKTKAEKKQTQQQTQSHGQHCNDIKNTNNTVTEEQIISIFSTGETVEKTPRGAKPIVKTHNDGNENGSGKSKNKKQKKAK
jgi:hypothetical protein